MLNFISICEENERKLQIIGIFRSPWAITLSKMARLYPKQILIINLYPKFHFSMYNQCEENEWKVGGQTDRQTAAKKHALPSSKGGITKFKIMLMSNTTS
jgi:hypothetical protein